MRIKFESNDIRNRLPYATSYPDLPKGDVPCINLGDNYHYMITGTSTKGGMRRSAAKVIMAAMRKVNPDYKMDSDTARLAMIGGVKGSGEAAHPNPKILQEVRRRNPLLELHGSGAPAMTSGCGIFGIMISQTTIHGDATHFGKVVFDKATRLPVIRRSLLNDPSISITDDISDPDKMMDDADLNRRRSKANKAIEVWKKMNNKSRRGDSLQKREQTALDNAKVELESEFKTTFETPEQAEAAYADMIKTMTASGTSDVSEANLHSFVFVPPDTVWNHKMELMHPSKIAIGLFMEAWNHKTRFHPYIGGNSARGCGGFLEGTYTVQRQEGDLEWIDDCIVSVTPDRGLGLSQLSNSSPSVIKEAWDEWKQFDITQCEFDFKEIDRILREGTE